MLLYVCVDKQVGEQVGKQAGRPLDSVTYWSKLGIKYICDGPLKVVTSRRGDGWVHT